MAKRRLLLNDEQTKAGTIYTVSNLGTSASITVDAYTELIIIESIASGVSDPSILKIEGTTKNDIVVQNSTSTNISILANTGGGLFWNSGSGNSTILKKLTSLRFTKLYDYFWMIDVASINNLTDTPNSYGSSIFDDYLAVYTSFTNKRLEYKRPYQHYNITYSLTGSSARITYNKSSTMYVWQSTSTSLDSIYTTDAIEDFQEVLFYNSKTSSITLLHNTFTGGFSGNGNFFFKDGVDFVLPAKSFIRLISLDNQFTNKIY